MEDILTNSRNEVTFKLIINWVESQYRFQPVLKVKIQSFRQNAKNKGDSWRVPALRSRKLFQSVSRREFVSLLYCLWMQSGCGQILPGQTTHEYDRSQTGRRQKKSKPLPTQSLLSDYVVPSKEPQLKELNMELCKILIQIFLSIKSLNRVSLRSLRSTPSRLLPVILPFVRIICPFYTTEQSKIYVLK